MCRGSDGGSQEKGEGRTEEGGSQEDPEERESLGRSEMIAFALLGL